MEPLLVVSRKFMSVVVICLNLILGNRKHEVNKCVKVSKDQPLSPSVPLQWENQMFSIPAIPPTINSCKFIKVSYILEVRFKLKQTLALHIYPLNATGQYMLLELSFDMLI